MPYYDFECSDCKVRKEAFVPMDQRQIPCTCGSSMDRLISWGICGYVAHDYAGKDYHLLKTQQDKYLFNSQHCGGDWFTKG